MHNGRTVRNWLLFLIFSSLTLPTVASAQTLAPAGVDAEDDALDAVDTDAAVEPDDESSDDPERSRKDWLKPPDTQGWIDAGTTLLGEHAPGVISRASAAVTIEAVGEEDGGIFKSIIMPWARFEGQLRLATGGPNPGLGGLLSMEGRVLDIHGTEDGIFLRFFPLDLNFSHEQQARPALSSRREFWARPYTRTTFGWSLFGGTIGGFEVLNMGLTTSHLEQPDAEQPLKQSRFEIGGHFFRYYRERKDRRPGFEAYLIRFEAVGIANAVGANASVASVDILRLDAIPLGKHLHLDVAGGFAGTGSMHISTSRNGVVTSQTTVITEELPDIRSKTGSARLYGTVGDITAEVSAGRSMYLTVNVELALEDRLSASATWLSRRGMLRLEGFAARNRLWLDETTEHRATTGGAFASWQQALDHDVTLTASLEVAHSFYGSMTGDIRPDSGLAVQAGATLTKHFGTPWNKRW